MCVRIAPWILTSLTLTVTGLVVDVRAEEHEPSRTVLEEAIAPTLAPAIAPTESGTSAQRKVDEETAEVIRERYENRSVKIERTVIRDEEHNYVNHGPWRMWDREGSLVAEGEYRDGKREGVWTGWYLRQEAPLLSQSPYEEYNGPFVSQATFEKGQLNGTWTIFDGQEQKISEWAYQNGVRHGKCVSWYANGNMMQEIEFQNGEIHGIVRQWSSDGEISMDESYEHGRRLGRKAEHYGKDKKKSEGGYLFAPRLLDGEDDWWDLKLAKYSERGEGLRHGDWETWYPNGQRKVHGKYTHGKPVDGFQWTWWHGNGQKAAEGLYRNGEQEGHWTWWHANGQRKLEGNFREGEHMGLWIWWAQSGTVAHKENYRTNDTKETLPATPEEGRLREAVAPEIIVESGEGPNVLVFPRTAELQNSDTIQE